MWTDKEFLRCFCARCGDLHGVCPACPDPPASPVSHALFPKTEHHSLRIRSHRVVRVRRVLPTCFLQTLLCGFTSDEDLLSPGPVFQCGVLVR